MVRRALLPVLLLLAGTASAAERLTDPTKAFVEGYDPSGNDFLANVPERTVLLRIRADLDGDGHPDLALSDSSTWGNAGGQWLLFRGQPDGAYVYWGTLFFAPATAVLRANELTVYVRTSASQGTFQTYRLAPDAIVPIATSGVDLDRPHDRAHYEATLTLDGRLPVEFCKLLEYRRQPATCWRPGLGLR